MTDDEDSMKKYLMALEPVTSPKLDEHGFVKPQWFTEENVTACTYCSGSLYGTCGTCGFWQLGQLRRENARMRAAIEAVLVGSAELEALRKAIE